MLERLKKKIPIERIWQTVNLNLRISSGRRANYLKKHHIFKNMGEHVSLQMRKIPLYPKLISFGNNIMVASNVSFLTHDAIHHVFNGLLEGQGESRRVNEKAGCIDIRDNCFIGANSIICNGVRIGPNAVVAAGAIVTKDVPPGCVAGGVPARVIGSFDDLLGKRIMEAENEPPVIRIEAQKISDEVIDWFWGEFYEKRKENELNEQ